MFASWRGRSERRSHITGQACPRILGHENHHRSKPDYYFMMGNSDLLAAFAVPMQMSMASSVKRDRERMPASQPAPRSIHGKAICPRVFVVWSKVDQLPTTRSVDGFPEGASEVVTQVGVPILTSTSTSGGDIFLYRRLRSRKSS